MSYQSAAFTLRVAKGLANGVAQEVDRLPSAEPAKVKQIISNLERDLECAISLCDKALKADTNVKLEDGTTPVWVKANVLFQKGRIRTCRSDFKEAVKYFEESIGYLPDQATYYNIGSCFLEMKGLFRDKTEDAVKAFEKCVELDPESELALQAGKALARLKKL